MEPHPSTSIVDEALKKIKFDKVVREEFFTISKGCVNLSNGVYDIEEGVLKEFIWAFGFKHNLGYAYDEKAECPNFMKFLDQLFPRDKKAIDFIQEFMGYIVSGDPCWLHKAAVFLGDGRNGKSTLNDVIRHLVGEKNVSAVGMKKLSDPTNFEMVSKALVNLADENSADSLAESDVLKNAISGGDVLVKKLYVQPFSVKNRAKFIFNCNTMPYSKDQSEGLYRRLIILSFEAEFDEQHGNVDVFILDKLLKELPGILNFAIQGYRRLKKVKRFTVPDTAKENMEIFKEAQNDVEDWFESHVIMGEGGFISSREAYTNYLDYCDKIGKRNRTATTPFYKKLSELFRKRGIVKDRGKDGNGLRTYGYAAKIRDGEARF
jgi:P4 family phage/plasmid primase-like protien